MMLFTAKGFHFTRFSLFFLLIVSFSLVFVTLCDDPTDFGGINVLHDAMREYLGHNIAKTRLTHDAVKPISVTNELFQGGSKRAKKNEATRARRDVVRAVAHRAQSDIAYVKYSWSRWLDMLYFSVSNTITMGYGDIFPISRKAKSLVIVQMISTFAVLCVEL